MFLRYIFCKAIPLRWYLFFMTSIDIILALIDSATLYQRIAQILSGSREIEYILSTCLFSLKLLLFIPLLTFEIILLKNNKLKSGKWVYGLKLFMFFLLLLFNVLGLFFLTDEGCNVFHTTLQKSSWDSVINNDKK